MDKKTVLTLAAGVVLGIVFHGQIARLPLVNKIPSI